MRTLKFPTKATENTGLTWLNKALLQDSTSSFMSISAPEAGIRCTETLAVVSSSPVATAPISRIPKICLGFVGRPPQKNTAGIEVFCGGIETEVSVSSYDKL